MENIQRKIIRVAENIIEAIAENNIQFKEVPTIRFAPMNLHTYQAFLSGLVDLYTHGNLSRTSWAQELGYEFNEEANKRAEAEPRTGLSTQDLQEKLIQRGISKKIQERIFRLNEFPLRRLQKIQGLYRKETTSSLSMSRGGIQIKEFIQDNHGLNESLKHGQVVLDNDLQALKTEEKKEEDVLNQIKTIIDVPATDSDFVKDIENFNNPKAILEYLAENLNQIEGLEISQLDAILDLALSRGVLSAI